MQQSRISGLLLTAITSQSQGGDCDGAKKFPSLGGVSALGGWGGYVSMDSKTINPIIMLGSYLGLLAGILLSLKGWYIFWWLPPLLGMNFDNLIILNAVGGFIAGYIFHILFRIFNCHTGGKKKQ